MKSINQEPYFNWILDLVNYLFLFNGFSWLCNVSYFQIHDLTPKFPGVLMSVIFLAHKLPNLIKLLIISPWFICIFFQPCVGKWVWQYSPEFTQGVFWKLVCIWWGKFYDIKNEIQKMGSWESLKFRKKKKSLTSPNFLNSLSCFIFSQEIEFNTTRSDISKFQLYQIVPKFRARYFELKLS